MTIKTLSFVWVLFLLANPVFGQPSPDTSKKKNPVSYNNVLWSGQKAQFTFPNLGERGIVKAKKMTFYAPDKVEMNFRIKVKPDGSVSYVAPPRVAPQLHEFRLGGTAALYGYQFSTIPTTEGDKWINVHMVVGE